MRGLGSVQIGEGLYVNTRGVIGVMLDIIREAVSGSKKEEAGQICWLLDLRRLSAAAAQVFNPTVHCTLPHIYSKIL